MNAYIKLFTTDPPTVTKTISPHPWQNMFGIILLLFLAGICTWIVIKSSMFFTMIYFTAATVAALTLAVLSGINLNKPTYEQTVSPNAPRIEKVAIQQAHKEYPYALTIGPLENSSGNKHYLLKRKPHKGLADLYKLRFADDSKPYIKHIGYRSLPATRSCSVNNSTSYLHDKVINNSKQGYLWEKPGKVLSGIVGLLGSW